MPEQTGPLTDELHSSVEALLFVATEPLSARTCAELLEIDEDQSLQVLSDLELEYRQMGRGFRLEQVAGGWRMYTDPDKDDLIRRYAHSGQMRRLSQAALEVLSIVAYTQPATREGIRAVRGVNSDSALATLVERGLVRQIEPVPGTLVSTFETTKFFLEYFGLNSLDDLPVLSTFYPDDRTRALISSRLEGLYNETNHDSDIIEDD